MSSEKEHENNSFIQALLTEIKSYTSQVPISAKRKKQAKELKKMITELDTSNDIVDLVHKLQEFRGEVESPELAIKRGQSRQRKHIKIGTLIDNIQQKLISELLSKNGANVRHDESEKMVAFINEHQNVIKLQYENLLTQYITEDKFSNIIAEVEKSELEEFQRKKLDAFKVAYEAAKAKNKASPEFLSAFNNFTLVINQTVLKSLESDNTIYKDAEKLRDYNQMLKHADELLPAFNNGKLKNLRDNYNNVNNILIRHSQQNTISQMEPEQNSVIKYINTNLEIAQTLYTEQLKELDQYIDKALLMTQNSNDSENNAIERIKKAKKLIAHHHYNQAMTIAGLMKADDVEKIENPELKVIISVIRKRMEFLNGSNSVDLSDFILENVEKKYDQLDINFCNGLTTRATDRPSFLDNCEKHSKETSLPDTEIDLRALKSRITKDFDTIIGFALNHPSKEVKVAALKSLGLIINQSKEHDSVRSFLDQYPKNKEFLRDLKDYFNGCNLDADIIDHLLVGYKNPMSLSEGESQKYTSSELKQYAVPILLNNGAEKTFQRIQDNLDALKDDDKVAYLKNVTPFIQSMILAAQSSKKQLDDVLQQYALLQQSLTTSDEALGNNLNSQITSIMEQAHNNLDKLNQIQSNSSPNHTATTLIDLSHDATEAEENERAKILANDMFISQIHHLSQVKPSDLHKCAWNKGPEHARPHAFKLIQHSTALSDMVTADIIEAAGGMPSAGQVLTEQQKEQAIKKAAFYVKVLEQCLKNNDLESANSIIGGLKSDEIFAQLKLINADFPNYAQLEPILADFSPSNSFARFRQKINNARQQEKPFITGWGLLFQNYDKLNDSPDKETGPNGEKRLNQGKMKMLAEKGFPIILEMHEKLLSDESLELTRQTNLDSYMLLAQQRLHTLRSAKAESPAVGDADVDAERVADAEAVISTETITDTEAVFDVGTVANAETVVDAESVVDVEAIADKDAVLDAQDRIDLFSVEQSTPDKRLKHHSVENQTTGETVSAAIDDSRIDLFSVEQSTPENKINYESLKGQVQSNLEKFGLSSPDANNNAARAYQEMIKTEVDYLNDLNVIDENKMNDIIELYEKLTPAELKDHSSLQEFSILYIKLNELRKSQQEVLQSLLDDDPSKWFEKLNSMKALYIDYVLYSEKINFPKQINNITMEKIPILANDTNEPMIDADGKPIIDFTGLSLRDYMFKPVQRAAKYPLLMREIIKEIPKIKAQDDTHQQKLTSLKENVDISNGIINSFVNDLDYAKKLSEEKPKLREAVKSYMRKPSPELINIIKSMTKDGIKSEEIQSLIAYVDLANLKPKEQTLINEFNEPQLQFLKDKLALDQAIQKIKPEKIDKQSVFLKHLKAEIISQRVLSNDTEINVKQVVDNAYRKFIAEKPNLQLAAQLEDHYSRQLNALGHPSIFDSRKLFTDPNHISQDELALIRDSLTVKEKVLFDQVMSANKNLQAGSQAANTVHDDTLTAPEMQNSASDSSSDPRGPSDPSQEHSPVKLGGHRGTSGDTQEHSSVKMGERRSSENPFRALSQAEQSTTQEPVVAKSTSEQTQTSAAPTKRNILASHRRQHQVKDEQRETTSIVQNINIQDIVNKAIIEQKSGDSNIKEIQTFPIDSEKKYGVMISFKVDKSPVAVKTYAEDIGDNNVKFSIQKNIDEKHRKVGIQELCRLAVAAADKDTVFNIPVSKTDPDRQEFIKQCFEKEIEDAAMQFPEGKPTIIMAGSPKLNPDPGNRPGPGGGAAPAA
tara:strand:- start:17080 stop:22356 length:5277 start_codon:yes stop_codon:yes gene_type:complete